jgi:trehalose utilization protein
VELEAIALEQYNLLQEQHAECFNMIQAIKASNKTLEERNHQLQEKVKNITEMVK